MKKDWIRKVTDRWYANVGRYDVRLKLRQIERICDEVRSRILSQPTLAEMMAAHKFYLEYIDPSFLMVENQIQAVARVVKYVQEMGFKYEDPECKMRYAFLDAGHCSDICKSTLECVQCAVQVQEPSCEIEYEARGTAMRDAGFLLRLAFDYTEKTCTLTQFDFI